MHTLVFIIQDGNRSLLNRRWLLTLLSLGISAGGRGESSG